jgi:hypothetical protein
VVKCGWLSPRDGVEQHVLAAQRLDLAAAHDALAVGEQHDLEQHRRRIGRCADFFVLEARLENVQRDVLIDQ